MITNNNGSRRHWVRKAIALPVLATAVIFFSCSKDRVAGKVHYVNLTLDMQDAIKLQKDSAEKKMLYSVKFKTVALRLGVKTPDQMKKLQDSVARVYYIGTK